MKEMFKYWLEPMSPHGNPVKRWVRMYSKDIQMKGKRNRLCCGKD
jgi:hypothetical protein